MEIDQWREPRKVALELRQQPFGDPGLGGFVLRGPISWRALCPPREWLPAADRHDFGGMVSGVSMSRVLERRERHIHRRCVLVHGVLPRAANLVAFIHPDVRGRSPML